jgi:hypothetical protein
LGWGGLGWGGAWPYYSSYDSCFRPRLVRTAWGWRRVWVNVCDAGWNGWGYGGAGWGTPGVAVSVGYPGWGGWW